eukprot:15840238-Heterocapsa_arctica.AAC.1
MAWTSTWRTSSGWSCIPRCLWNVPLSWRPSSASSWLPAHNTWFHTRGPWFSRTPLVWCRTADRLYRLTLALFLPSEARLE